jgi:cytochrome c
MQVPGGTGTINMNNLPWQMPIRAAHFVALIALAALLAACSSLQLSVQPAQVVAGGDPQRGALAIRSYGCGTCHRIPGIAGADSMVGPPLDDWVERHYIAGGLPNQPDFLIEWIRFPQAIEPGNAMPNMGVTEQEARDMSAYLYTSTQD